MTDMTAFLSSELTEMGLMAAADPQFAERLLEALRRLAAEPGSEPASAAAEGPEVLVTARRGLA
jgi:hypothetical protein